MTTTLRRFDAADYLRDEADIAAYLDACGEDNDPALIAHALGAIARARNVSQLARDAGMTRAGFTRALGQGGNPSFATISRVATALGLKISFAPAAAAPRKARTSERSAKAARKSSPKAKRKSA